MYNTIMGYVIEQADRNDKHILQIEQDIISQIKLYKNKLDNGILIYVSSITSQLILSQFMIKVQAKFEEYTSNVKRILLDAFDNHYNLGYHNVNNYIDIANELSRKFNKNITEMQISYNNESVKYIQEHAFDLLKGYSSSKVEKIRSELQTLFLTGRSDKDNVKNSIIKILGTNASKAEEITQTELSRAYNYGTISNLYNYNKANPTDKVKKYWHGFKYSEVTCTYCRPRIGNIFDIDDNMEVLPAHVRCRCVWLPYKDGWTEEQTIAMVTETQSLKDRYTINEIQDKMNSRLGIKYGDYIDPDISYRYIGGDRSQNVLTAISYARQNAINDIISKLDIYYDKSHSNTSRLYIV